MFDNIGGKIKGLAKFLAITGIVIGIIAGIVIMVAGGAIGVLIGFVVMALVGLLSWVGSFALAGFGQLIESAQNIENKLYEGAPANGSMGTNTSFSFSPAAEEEPYHPEEARAAEDREPQPGEWVCPRCGRINQSYTGTCGCGMTKDDSSSWNPGDSDENEDSDKTILDSLVQNGKISPGEYAEMTGNPLGTVKCPQCNTVLKNDAAFCPRCGAKLK